MAEPFIDVDELSDLLRQDVSTELMASFAVAAACDVVRNYTHQTLTLVTDDTVRLDAPVSDILLLPQLPIQDVTSVIIDPDADSPTTLTQGTDYTIRADAGVLLRSQYYLWRAHWAFPTEVEVTYSHGYLPDGSGEDAFPMDLKMAAVQIAARLYSVGQPVQTGSNSIQAESIGNWSVTYGLTNASSVSDEERRLLDPYRIARVC